MQNMPIMRHSVSRATQTQSQTYVVPQCGCLPCQRQTSKDGNVPIYDISSLSDKEAPCSECLCGLDTSTSGEIGDESTECCVSCCPLTRSATHCCYEPSAGCYRSSPLYPTAIRSSSPGGTVRTTRRHPSGSPDNNRSRQALHSTCRSKSAAGANARLSGALVRRVPARPVAALDKDSGSNNGTDVPSAPREETKPHEEQAYGGIKLRCGEETKSHKVLKGAGGNSKCGGTLWDICTSASGQSAYGKVAHSSDKTRSRITFKNSKDSESTAQRPVKDEEAQCSVRLEDLGLMDAEAAGHGAVQLTDTPTGGTRLALAQCLSLLSAFYERHKAAQEYRPKMSALPTLQQSHSSPPPCSHDASHTNQDSPNEEPQSKCSSQGSDFSEDTMSWIPIAAKVVCEMHTSVADTLKAVEDELSLKHQLKDNTRLLVLDSTVRESRFSRHEAKGSLLSEGRGRWCIAEAVGFALKGKVRYEELESFPLQQDGDAIARPRQVKRDNIFENIGPPPLCEGSTADELLTHYNDMFRFLSQHYKSNSSAKSTICRDENSSYGTTNLSSWRGPNSAVDYGPFLSKFKTWVNARALGEWRDFESFTKRLKSIMNHSASRFDKFPLLHPRVDDKTASSRFIVLNQRGKGGFAEVWEVIETDTLERFAAKITEIKDEMSGDDQDAMIAATVREVKLQRRIKHPNIVEMRQCFDMDAKTFVAILEVCEGPDLDFVIYGRQRNDSRMSAWNKGANRTPACVLRDANTHTSIPCEKNSSWPGVGEETARVWMREIMSALTHIHTQGRVIHFDLKPHNILLHQGHCKIADFGLHKPMSPKGVSCMSAGALKANERSANTRLKGGGGERYDKEVLAREWGWGTVWYMPPEYLTAIQLNEECNIDGRYDVWSAGVILYELLYRRRPFGERGGQHNKGTVFQRRDAILRDWISSGVVVPSKPLISPRCKDFLLKLLSPVDDRPSAAEALRHPFLTENQSKLSGRPTKSLGGSPAHTSQLTE